jgi:glycerol-3-phosphate O-acyltransferase
MDEIIAHGLDNVGMYHAKRPLIKDASGNLSTEDMSLLYFYHNRLHGYGLEKLF